nr:DUF3131 domain-containing protein [Klebsiella pneumoniae subsp. pneumoniae]
MTTATREPPGNPWRFHSARHATGTGVRLAAARRAGRGTKAMRERAEGIWLSQKTRWTQDKVLTARADFSLTQAPGTWKIPSGEWLRLEYARGRREVLPRLAQVTTKAVFVLWTLWETEYTDALMAVTTHLNDRSAAGLKDGSRPPATSTPPSPSPPTPWCWRRCFTNTTPGRCSKRPRG